VPKKDGAQMTPSTLKSQWWNWVARQKIDPHLPILGLRDSCGTWVYETYGVKQAQVWRGHSDPVTWAALERAQEKILEDARQSRDNVVSLAGRRR
jgi:integrase